MRLPLRNVTDRQHWAVRRKEREKLAWLVAWALPAHLRPAQPINTARIVITRYSTQAPDTDGLYASVKGLLDILQPLSKRHPLGMGVIFNDSPQHLFLTVKHAHSKEARTDVEIYDETHT
jgi:hypothetical protein